MPAFQTPPNPARGSTFPSAPPPHLATRAPGRPPSDAIYREAWRGAYRTARFLGLPPHDAEDVASTTVLRLVGSYAEVADGRPLNPWVNTVARNLVIDQLRTQRRRRYESLDAPAPGADRTQTVGELLVGGAEDPVADVVVARAELEAVLGDFAGAVRFLRAGAVNDRYAFVGELAIFTGADHAAISAAHDERFGPVRTLAPGSVAKVLERIRTALADDGRFPSALARLGERRRAM